MPQAETVAYYEVTAGREQGKPLSHFTRWFELTREDMADPEVVGATRSAAHRYADGLIEPSRSATWTKVDFVRLGH